MSKLIFILLIFLVIGCKTQCVCVYVEPIYETEVIDFGGLIDEQCYNQCDYFEYPPRFKKNFEEKRNEKITKN